ncbi:MAG: hypothetical protein J6R66_04820 [Clostridia bacterium]|nr:hypothetical protein [Clostridia bacterium]
MLKRMTLIALSAVLMLSVAACGKNIKNKESVSVKESELYSNYQLDETALKESPEFEQGGVKVTMTGITYEDVITKFNYHIKNDTDKKIKVVTTDLSVNGLMCTDAMMIDIDAKSEKDSFIEISNEWFAELNIKTVKDIEFVIRVLDENAEEIIKSDVLKAKTDASKKYKQQYDNEGVVIYKKGGIVLAARELKKSKLSNDMELTFYVENNTDQAFSIMANEVSVNGTPVNPTFVITVGAHKKAVDSMLFHEADLSEGRITEFKTVKASFRAINDNLETVFETKVVEIPIQ